MKIENRLNKIEKKVIIPNESKLHVIVIDEDDDEDQAINDFKENNEVCEDDRFWTVTIVSPKGMVQND